MNPDAINGSMEFFSAGLVLLNVRRLMIDRRVAGVSLVPTLFFDAWGFWNVFYYWQLNQPFSWYGGACLFTVNVVWTVLAFWYSRGVRV